MARTNTRWHSTAQLLLCVFIVILQLAWLVPASPLLPAPKDLDTATATLPDEPHRLERRARIIQTSFSVPAHELRVNLQIHTGRPFDEQDVIQRLKRALKVASKRPADALLPIPTQRRWSFRNSGLSNAIRFGVNTTGSPLMVKWSDVQALLDPEQGLLNAMEDANFFGYTTFDVTSLDTEVLRGQVYHEKNSIKGLLGGAVNSMRNMTLGRISSNSRASDGAGYSTEVSGGGSGGGSGGRSRGGSYSGNTTLFWVPGAEPATVASADGPSNDDSGENSPIGGDPAQFWVTSDQLSSSSSLPLALQERSSAHSQLIQRDRPHTREFRFWIPSADLAVDCKFDLEVTYKKQQVLQTLDRAWKYAQRKDGEEVIQPAKQTKYEKQNGLFAPSKTFTSRFGLNPLELIFWSSLRHPAQWKDVAALFNPEDGLPKQLQQKDLFGLTRFRVSWQDPQMRDHNMEQVIFNGRLQQKPLLKHVAGQMVSDIFRGMERLRNRILGPSSSSSSSSGQQ